MKTLSVQIICFLILGSLLLMPLSSWAQSSSVEKEVELEFWRAIKDSDDPAMINAYLQKYPDGDFAILANIKIKKLLAKYRGLGIKIAV